VRSLYYCLGGGLGHITRFNAFCRTFSVTPDLFTNCEEVRNGKIKTAAASTCFPDTEEQKTKNSLADAFKKAIKSSRPEQIIIDAFPAGILGELAGIEELKNLECVFLARILKMSAYLRRLDSPLPDFAQIYVLEELIPDQSAYFSANATIENLVLTDDDAPIAECHIQQISGRWLIVHSENGEELHSLYKYAQNTAEIEKCRPDFAVIAPGVRPGWLPKQAIFANIYPAHELFPVATRVFSGAGFNIVRQMRQMRDKHFIMPFNRALDDQHYRAEKARNQI